MHEKRGCCSSWVRKCWRHFQRLLCGWLGWYAVSSRGCTRAFCSSGQGSQPCACASSIPFPCWALHIGKRKSSSVPGRNVNVQEEPAWRRRRAAVSRALSVALTNGLVVGGLLCGQGDAWFLSVNRRGLGWVMRSLDLVLSRPAVSMLLHHSLCDLMLDCNHR